MAFSADNSCYSWRQQYLLFIDCTVLSGAEERGVNGPSLDRSYFSRLQPISFLFFDPSSSHIAKLVARIQYSAISTGMLHTHATHARPGKKFHGCNRKNNK